LSPARRPTRRQDMNDHPPHPARERHNHVTTRQISGEWVGQFISPKQAS
jgi:hypothetical protein